MTSNEYYSLPDNLRMWVLQTYGGNIGPVDFNQVQQLYDAAQQPQAPPPPSGPMITVAMPSGGNQQFHIDDPALDAAFRAGARPYNSSGELNTDVLEFNGGWIIGNNGGYETLNKYAGGAWLPGQEEALTSAGYNLPTTGGGGTTTVPPTTTPPPTGVDPLDWASSFGLNQPIPQIGPENIAVNPQISQTFSPGFNEYWQEFASGQGVDVGKFYDWGDWPTMEAAQLDQAGIPQTQAQQVGSNRGLDFLLSGQGLDPATMQLMRARNTAEQARSGASQRSSAKLAAQQAGLQDSGANLAMQGQINRRQGDNIARGNYDLDIANAQLGLQNLTQGAGMELQRGTTNAGMANQMALENAARLFAGMQQNVANQQQSNLTNNQNSQQRNLSRANTQAGLQGSLAQGYNQSALERANQSDFANASNAINRNLNQAQLNRQQSMFNVGTQENRYGQAANNLVSLINNTSPTSYYSGASGQQYQPNLFGANMWQNFGNNALNQGT